MCIRDRIRDLLRRNRLRYSLKKCQYGTEALDQWIISRETGVFILILQGQDALGDDIYHAVVIDARSKVIVDSCEAPPIRLEWLTIQFCFGHSTYVGIADARELHRQVEGTSKNSRSRP